MDSEGPLQPSEESSNKEEQSVTSTTHAQTHAHTCMHTLPQGRWSGAVSSFYKPTEAEQSLRKMSIRKAAKQHTHTRTRTPMHAHGANALFIYRLEDMMMRIQEP